MPIIETKRVNRKWFCFGTINGYDHSFEGTTKVEAQDQMRDLLKRLGITEAQWEHDREYDTKSNTQKTMWKPFRIDKGMV